MCIQVEVRGPTGGWPKIVDVCDTANQLKKITVLQLKQKLVKELSIKDDLRLVFCSKTLAEEDSLETCMIRHLSVVYILLMLPGGN